MKKLLICKYWFTPLLALFPTLDNSELKKVILREFHEKPYSGHPGYQKTLNVVNKFYYWLNLKRYVEKFVARCLDYQ